MHTSVTLNTVSAVDGDETLLNYLLLFVLYKGAKLGDLLYRYYAEHKPFPFTSNSGHHPK